MSRIFLTRPIPGSARELLSASCDLVVRDIDSPITPKELLEGVQDADGLLCMLTDAITSDVIEAAPRLRVISNYAVGFNNIDVAAAWARGIAVTNTPGVLTDATADTALALLLCCARRIAESDRWMRTHDFLGWSPTLFVGRDLRHATLGIVGAGRIGVALAERCVGAFAMTVLYSDVVENPDLETRLGARRVPLNTLLAESDFVSLHAPLTADTLHLIGPRQLDMMKRTAILINTARGPMVDEAALVDALENGTIAGAGLDVYEQEPMLHPRLRSLDSVVLLPHIGSASEATRATMSEMAARNLLLVLEGKEPLSRVLPS